MQAILSIHDVMPHSLHKVAAIIKGLPPGLRHNLILLVVPGLDWQPRQIRQLHAWQDNGFILAGHGWRHRADKVNTVYHRLHALLLSRQAAEHLSLSEQQILHLLEDCYQWFARQGLQQPDLYVPPAWALGRIALDGLQQSPFRYVEHTCGFTDTRSGKSRILPLVGFEADTDFRRICLGLCNRVNLILSQAREPLRISIHPDDYRLKLAAGINPLLNRVASTVHYSELF